MTGEDITRIVAVPCCDSSLTPNHWRKLKVFAILKDQWDEMKREEQRRNTVQVGKIK